RRVSQAGGPDSDLALERADEEVILVRRPDLARMGQPVDVDFLVARFPGGGDRRVFAGRHGSPPLWEVPDRWKLRPDGAAGQGRRLRQLRGTGTGHAGGVSDSVL